jgi:hypothetical protein
VTPYAYELELPASIRIHRVQHVSLLDPVVEDPLEQQVVLPPPPVEVDGEQEYQVSSVEDRWVYRSQLQNLIRWMGYDSLMWESVKFVDGLRAVDEFHPRYPEKPGPLENALGGPRPEGGDTVTALGNMMVIGNNGGRLWVVWKELCYGKAETLGDVEEVARWWRDNLVR